MKPTTGEEDPSIVAAVAAARPVKEGKARAQQLAVASPVASAAVSHKVWGSSEDGAARAEASSPPPAVTTLACHQDRQARRGQGRGRTQHSHLWRPKDVCFQLRQQRHQAAACTGQGEFHSGAVMQRH